VKDATVYFQIVSAGLVFQAVNMGVTAALRERGNNDSMIYNVGIIFSMYWETICLYSESSVCPNLRGRSCNFHVRIEFLACVVGLCVVFFLKWSAISIRLKGSYRINFDIAREIFSIGLPRQWNNLWFRATYDVCRTVSSLGTVTFAAHQ